MPLSPRHKEQKNKNLTLLVILLALAALLFTLTAIKMSGTP